jgi:hypothetical protein
MDIEQLKEIESAEAVEFSLKPDSKIAIKGTDSAVDRVLARIDRDEVAALLAEHRPLIEPVVERVISTRVPALAIQRQNYISWFMAKSGYYQPTEDQLDRMFSVLQEGDEVLPDFAHSFSVRRPNGSIIQVDRKGRISQPSPYSPAVTKRQEQ